MSEETKNWMPLTQNNLPAYGEAAIFKLNNVSKIERDTPFFKEKERYPYFIGVIEYRKDGWGKLYPVSVSAVSYKPTTMGFQMALSDSFGFKEVSAWCRIPQD